MARSCNCAGSSCSCLVIAGFGIAVTGIGTASDPYVVTNTAADLAVALQVTDTATVDMVRAGSGTDVDPLILSANVVMKLQQLSDIQNPGGVPVAGQRPVYVGVSGTTGHWEFQSSWPQFTTAGRPAVASTPEGYTYFDTTLGKPVWRKNSTTYVDATGATV